MKYTIEGFYQPSLVDAGLDVTDAMILRWFIDFSGSGAMFSRKMPDGIYFYVRYKSVAEEFPVLGITSVRGITRRFDVYVEKGLLKRKTLNTSRGLMPFFSKTERLVAMLYDGTAAAPVKSGTDLKITGAVRTKFSPEEQIPGDAADKDTCTEGVGTAIHTPSEAPFRPGMNDSSGALNHSSINNPAIKNSSTPTTPLQHTAEEDLIKSCIKKIFGGHYVFDTGFAQCIARLASEFGLKADEFPAYLDFVSEVTRKKKPESITNLFYTLAKSPTVMQDFLASPKYSRVPDSTEKNVLNCPVCGTEHDKKSRECPICGCRDSDRADAQRLAACKRAWSLPAGARKKYGDEMANLEKEFSSHNILSDRKAMAAYRQAKKDIDMKYGIIQPENKTSG